MNHENLIILDMDLTLISTFIYPIEEINNLKNLNLAQQINVLKTNPQLYPVLNPKDNNFFNKFFLTKFIINNNLYIIFYRPFLFNFLNFISKNYKLVIYSLGRKTYIFNIVSEIIRLLNYNPFYQIICNSDDDSNYVLTKTINKIYLNIHQSNIIIIDDNEEVWNIHKHLVYKIKPFLISNYDFELLNLLKKIEFYNKNANKENSISNFIKNL